MGTILFSFDPKRRMNADFLLIIAVFEAFFLSVLVLAKNRKQISDYLLPELLGYHASIC